MTNTDQQKFSGRHGSLPRAVSLLVFLACFLPTLLLFWRTDRLADWLAVGNGVIMAVAVSLLASAACLLISRKMAESKRFTVETAARREASLSRLEETMASSAAGQPPAATFPQSCIPS